MKSLKPISILAVAEKKAMLERLVQALHQILENADCTVADIASGPVILAHQPPDIVFCDAAFAVSEHIGSGNWALDGTPVILLTNGGANDAPSGLNPAGIVDVADLQPRQLEKAVRSALHYRQAHYESRLRQYESLVNRSPAVVFLWRISQNWPVEFVTENVRQFGYASSDFLAGRISWPDFVHPDDMPRLEADMRRYVREKSPVFFEEYRVVTAGGEVRWVEETTTTVFDNAGNPTHYQGILLDTTERREAQNALDHTRNVYKNLIMTAPDAVFTMDDEAHVLFASPLAADIMGFENSDEVVGVDTMEHVAPEYKDRAREAFTKAAEEGAVRGVELLVLREDGTSMHIELNATALYDTNGRVIITAIARDISERVRAEEALKVSEAKFRSILDNSRDVAYKLNIETSQYDYVSPSISMFGLTPEQFMKQGKAAYRNRVHPDDAAIMDKLYERFFQDPERYPLPATIEYRIRSDEGEYRWIADTFRAVFDANGRFVAEVGNIRDITDRKNAEAMLVAQRDFALKLAACRKLNQAVSLCLHTAIELSGMEAGCLYLCERDGDFYLADQVGLSEETAQEFEYAASHSPRTQMMMKGVPVYGLYSDLPVLHTPITSREGFKGLAIIPILDRNRTVACLNLGSRWKETIPPITRKALETIAAHAGSALARLQAEQDLRESEEKYRNLVENAYDGICIVQDGKLKYLNLQLAQMLEAGVEQLVDADFSAYFHSEAAADSVRQAADSPLPAARPALFETQLARHDAKTVETEVKASPIMYLNRRAALVIVRDVTARNRTLREVEDQRLELVAASRMSELGMMASGVAHEINNPLAIISGVAEQLRKLLADYTTADSPLNFAAQQAETIERHAHRIERIVQNMKAFARDGVSDALKTCPVANIASDALDLCEARFVAHGIRLDVPEIDEDHKIECRPAQISQVLVNLLSNAFDAVENADERWVRIDFAASESHIELAVADGGPAMTAEVKERAMRPYFTSKRIGKGSGLGLTISKNIIENHHGSLEIDHNHANTRFVVRLPRRQPQCSNEGA